MNAVTTTQQAHAPSVIGSMAERFGMDRRAFEQTLMATVMPADRNGNHPAQEQVAAFLLVAKKYSLNPFTKEIYAFPGKGGGIQPIVSIDGWMKIINDHPDFDGMDFEDHAGEGGKLVSITCRMHRKTRAHPVEVTEYMSECVRATEPWQKWPARMLRHKAAIQAARYAFGFSGIMDPDEAERMASVVSVVQHDAEPARPELGAYSPDAFAEFLPKWQAVIESGKRSADDIIALAETKGVLTDEQKAAIRDCAPVSGGEA